MMETPHATVAIPAFNPDPQVFQRVLGAVLSLHRPVVVVDMSTDNRVIDLCRAGGSLVKYERFTQSTGVAQSRNRCVELSSSRYVVFLDVDAFPCGDWAAPMLRRLSEPDVGVVGARIVPAWRGRPPRLFQSYTAGIMLSLLDLGPTSIDLPVIIGTSYAVDRERVPSPPFDESVGRRPGVQLSGEENKLCIESRRMGYRVVYEPDSVVFHDIAPIRLRWRWIWARAYTAGRERRFVGPGDPFPHPPPRRNDHAFKAAVALPFLAGRLRGAPKEFG
jgi:GT2 family glycosyltransferase